ncbi:MAG: FecR domain-containing protein [Hyphomicrobiales bacterium]|nr:FecR domain-containing protein [Hyphomicrobiales bacterium]
MKASKQLEATNRREFLATLAGCAGGFALSTPALAADPIGAVTALTGRATADRSGGEVSLKVGAGVMVRDLIRTGARSFLAMRLGDETSMRLGEDTELLIDEYLLDVRGSFDMSNGALVFDRPQGAAKTPTTVRTVFGQLGVRGTRFFAGPGKGVFGVFVERGELEVSAAGVTQLLTPGDGVNIAEPGAAASQVAKWGQARIDEAFASVIPN